MQQFADNVVDQRGNVVVGAQVTILKLDGTNAALFAADGVSAIGNPVTSGVDGAYTFVAAGGRYKRRVTYLGATTDIAGEIVLTDGLVLADYLSAAAAVVAAAGKRLVIGAGESVTLNVPGQFATIQAALAAMASWTISNTGTATIALPSGNIQLTTTVVLEHANSDRIRIIGTGKADCFILGSNPPTFDAFMCTRGKFGLLDGFTVKLASKAASTNNFTAILALGNGTINCGQDIGVDNWYYGIAARSGGKVFANYATVDHAGDVGVWSETGGHVECRYAVSNNASDATNGLGFGFQAEHGSTMDCSNASASGCLVAGIAALTGSSVRAWNATPNGNTGSGFYAFGGSVIEAHNATANTNTRYGIEELDSSRVFGNSITLTGNTLAGTKPRAYFDNTTLGARLVSSGDFRVDLSGANTWFFNSSGGLQLRINHTANAVNRWAISGSPTGTGLVMLADGTDATIHGAIKPKGAGGQAQMQSADGTVKIAANDTGIGFNATTPVAKPSITGSRGGNAALASLLTQLASTGLITDSTTA